MSTHLPILVPGRTEPVLVPCRLPDSFDFRAFLPARGVRVFTCWLTSLDPLKAEVGTVRLSRRETDPRFRSSYALDEDEQNRADEAAGDVLATLFVGLNVNIATRTPYNRGCEVLHAIALAWEAEVSAATHGGSLASMFRKRPGCAGTSAPEDIERLVPDLSPTGSGSDKSAACEALRCYVSEVVDAAVLAQADKAECQHATWEPAPLHPEDRSLPAWAE